MGLLLSIETTTTNCSVALGKDGNLLALQEHNSKSYSHAEELHPFIKKVINAAGEKLQHLDAIAVSKGPGSYTGLRIGVAAAKGLCFSLNRPLLAIDTLTLLALQTPPGEFSYTIPMLDARRMEVYCAVYNAAQKRTQTEAVILDKTSFHSYLNDGKTLFIGTGIEKFKSICDPLNAHFIEAYPSAREMIKVAEKKFKNKEFEDVAYFKPFYLKDFFIKKKN